LSQLATDAYEASRGKIQNHINAQFAHEVLLLLEPLLINLVANGFASILKPGDEVLVSAMEHHSNIVPWQMLCERTGATLKVIPMNDNGELIMVSMINCFRTKLRL
jgi:cysteine desulfurase/selenocysteine lyase